MTIIDRAVAGVALGREAKARLDQDGGDAWIPQLSIVGDPAACLTLKEAAGARSLWEDVAPRAGHDRRLCGRFAGHDVFAVPSDVVSDRTLLNVLLGAKVVATIDFLPPMAPALFYAAVQAVWGEAWRSSLYGILGVPDRTIRRWIDGRSPIPQGVAREIVRALDKRQVELARLAGAIRGE